MIKPKTKVKLGENSYPIYIEENIVSEIGNIIGKIGSFSKYILVTDSNVAKFYLKDVENSLKILQKPFKSIILRPGEKTKSFKNLNYLVEKILQNKIDRNSVVIALGGGVIGDLVGFAASIVLRGLPYIQIPTTLLAQVDSSVGGKTGINSIYGKNLIGSFKQPIAVISSINMLNSLQKREINSGYAEILKYSLIADKNFFKWLLDNGKDIIKLQPKNCIKAIKKSCEIKSNIVSIDEKESGIRAFLNLGHTFGHSIESITNYSKKINHGEAVFVGTLMALKFSNYLNLCKSEIPKKYQEHLKILGIKHLIDDYKIKTNSEEIYKHMLFDKKMTNGKLNFIVIRDFGKPQIYKLENKKTLITFLRKEVFK